MLVLSDYVSGFENSCIDVQHWYPLLPMELVDIVCRDSRHLLEGSCRVFPQTEIVHKDESLKKSSHHVQIRTIWQLRSQTGGLHLQHTGRLTRSSPFDCDTAPHYFLQEIVWQHAYSQWPQGLQETLPTDENRASLSFSLHEKWETSRHLMRIVQ